jgi:transcription-repair coupling factor (superfamily II helicase)
MLDSIKIKIWDHLQELSIPERLIAGGSVDVKGMVGSFQTIFAALFLERLDRQVLAVLPDREEAEWMAEELDALMGEGSASFFPASGWEDGEIAALNPRKSGMQMEILRDLQAGIIKAVVTTSQGILVKTPSPSHLGEKTIRLTEGADHDPYRLMESLQQYGYSRESMVERPGEFSLRGGILDVFPYTGEEPHRIEFSGDRIESIRTFDIASQLSKSKGLELILVPSFGGDSERTSSLLSFLDPRAVLIMKDPELAYAEAERERQRGRKDVWDPERLESMLSQIPAVRVHTLGNPPGIVDLGSKAVAKQGLLAGDMRRQWQDLAALAFDTVLVAEQEEQALRIGVHFGLDEQPVEGVTVTVAPVRKGFQIPELRLAVYCESDLFNRSVRKRRKGRFKEGLPIRELSTLSEGDFVVHVDFGIGQYSGLEKIRVRDVERECLVLLYRDGDKLYVPVDKMERVQKYRSKEGARPELNKLGGVQWERLKSKTKANVKEIARELAALYSARQTLPGHAFPPDSAWQRELDSSFAFEETPDQVKAIDDVRSDMESAKPMDRLVCGDVGYGKTEVAVRAAFKCVSDGRQVALLVPTTLLAQQHFRTFRERLSAFPVNVEVLSRFRSRKQQAEIIRDAQSGKIDILIGTHRILSKDVGFSNLGLLIIDEEQRFGVKHKETLKRFRRTVDVMTLTATPIPRTLYFSLMGIRDMSIINTPPKDRHPIVTEVLPFSEEVVVEAIQRELGRRGQVFFVHNRIHSIHAVAAMVQRLVPEARVAMAHGRMDEEELEKVMVDFDEGRYDCLVATTIIESGLDLPNVNTLVINRADQMGLAQLYQLRGRVGRSDHQAYAYLFTPPFELLNDEAVKRLRTIEEFTELGSGFQIAQRDLEIRGAGNMLGIEQSGNIDALGYDMYMRLVEEAVDELRRERDGSPEPKAAEPDCQVEMDVDAFLPDTYVSDESIRVELYRKLAGFRQTDHVDRFESELRDRFGRMPAEAEHLLDVARLRLMGAGFGFKRIVAGKDGLRLYFDDQWSRRFDTPEPMSRRLRSMVETCVIPMRFIQKGGFGISGSWTTDDVLAETKKVLQSLG